MSLQELAKYINRPVSAVISGARVLGKVVDVRMVYGCLQYRVQIGDDPTNVTSWMNEESWRKEQ